MKNWSTTTKVIVVILALLLIWAILYQFTNIFGNEKGFFAFGGVLPSEPNIPARPPIVINRPVAVNAPYGQCGEGKIWLNGVCVPVVRKQKCEAGGIEFSDGQCSTGYRCDDGKWKLDSKCGPTF